MTFDPSEIHRARALRDFTVDRLNKLFVLHRLFLRIFPAVLLPAFDPLGRAIDGVLRIRFDEQWLRARVRSQSFQHCAQLTNLIGAVGRAARIITMVVVLMAGLAAGVLLMIGPGPAHWPVWIP